MTPSVMLKPGPNGELLLVPVRPDGSEWVRWTGHAEARLQSRQSAEVSHRSQVGFHSSSPSQRPQSGAESDAMSSERSLRKLGYSDKPVTLREVKGALSDALATKIPQYRVPAKEVAHRIEASEGTVENLRQRGVTDGMARLVLLARHYPAFGAEVRRLMGPGADLDPDFQRDLADFLRRVL